MTEQQPTPPGSPDASRTSRTSRAAGTSGVYDLVGVGIGPFNLSLAALCDGVPELRTLFLDRRPAFSWHPGLLLEGSVRRERNRVRASLRVVNVVRDSTAWSGAFEGSMDSLFAFQAQVADAAFNAVRAARGGSPAP